MPRYLRGFLVLLATTAACDSGGMNPPPPPPVAAVAVTSTSSTLIVGTSLTVTATLRDANGAVLTGRTVQWASSDGSKAAVSATGVVTGHSPGSVTITATSEGITGALVITVIVPPVALVTVTSATSSVFVGRTLAVTATLKDATGSVLNGRTIQWTTSDPARATVSNAGVVTGVSTGAATISATSESVVGSLVIIVNAIPANVIVTGLQNPVDFAAHCPGDDPAFPMIRNDFVLLSDGVPSTTTITCADPYSSMSPMTEELMEWQALRLIYTMSPGTAGKLPWTTLSLYDWLKAQVAGIDIRTQPGNSACCETINGKRYFFTSRKDATSLNFYHDWIGLSNWVGLILHEARHVLGPAHVNGCPDFPLSTDPFGCDATYDLQNLGSYGVQYWFFSNLAAGTLNVGIACLPAATAQQYATSAASSANGYPTRFVTNAPPTVTAPAPYGGTCF